MYRTARIHLGDVPEGTDSELYKQTAIAALQGLLANPYVLQQMQAEDDISIKKDEWFDPWQNRIGDMALECADCFLRRLVD
ncbi:MAG: hypothetical protein KME10_11760 [Plectolyngbya sp. WJT66-NPBG17]|nr:hypothetical protein [Plectolyngbya sp. WJT66-NPBG17]